MYESEHASNKKRGRSCLFYGLLLIVGMPLLLIALFVLIVLGRERSARRELNVRLDRIKAQGLPVDNASMQTYFNKLTSDEYTEAWLEAIAEATSDEFNDSCEGVPRFDASIDGEIPASKAEASHRLEGDAGDSDEPWPEEGATRRFLARWNGLGNRVQRLALAQLADGAKPVRFPLEFDSINTLLTNTQHMRQLARLLYARGMVAVFDRESTNARQNIAALIGCSKVLEGEPILVSQLVSIALDGMAMDVLKSALEYDVLESDDLAILLELVLERKDISKGWELAMNGERAMMLPIFDNPTMVTPQSTPAIPFRSRDALNYLDVSDSVLAVATEDLDEFRTELAKIEANLQLLVSGGWIQRMDSIVTGMLAPAIAPAGDAYVRNAMQHRIAVLGIGIRLFEEREGSFPDSLQILEEHRFGDYVIEETQLMPPGKKPFGYLVDSEGALLWGFDLQHEQSTPDQPPVAELGEPYFEQKKYWKWRLQTVADATSETPTDQ